MSSAREIVVGRPTLADRSTIRYALTASPPLRGYFTNEAMFVTHDADVADVPEAILLVPFLATLAPIAWALEAELRVRAVDATFLASLARVKEALRVLHPTVEWGGAIRPDAVVDCRGIRPADGEAILFSGGVDSVTSYLLHRDAKPRLIAVWGADVGLRATGLWNDVARAMRVFAAGRSAPISFVTSNLRTFFNHYRLRSRFLPSFANWYSGAQQGLGLIGLCAPLAWVHGLGRIRIGSVQTAASVVPWGSHPTIDDHVCWADTRGVHDGYELDRQAKLGVIARYIRDEDPRLVLRVCWGGAANCSRCTKCCLTMVGLALEGIDPNRHGFRFDRATLVHIRAGLEQGRMYLTDVGVACWTEIQRAIPRRKRLEIDGLDDLLAWLETIPIRRSQARYNARIRPALRRYLETRAEPVGRWMRKRLGHPFP